LAVHSPPTLCVAVPGSAAVCKAHADSQPMAQAAGTTDPPQALLAAWTNSLQLYSRCVQEQVRAEPRGCTGEAFVCSAPFVLGQGSHIVPPHGGRQVAKVARTCHSLLQLHCHTRGLRQGILDLHHRLVQQEVDGPQAGLLRMGALFHASRMCAHHGQEEALYTGLLQVSTQGRGAQAHAVAHRGSGMGAGVAR
jgi:hypothetical protein